MVLKNTGAERKHTSADTSADKECGQECGLEECGLDYGRIHVHGRCRRRAAARAAAKQPHGPPPPSYGLRSVYVHAVSATCLSAHPRSDPHGLHLMVKMRFPCSRCARNAGAKLLSSSETRSYKLIASHGHRPDSQPLT
jgi:hypothetical protein